VTQKIDYKDLYIALENRNLDWRQEEVKEFERLCSEGYELEQISRFFKRHLLETLVLYLDLIDRNKIEPTYKVVRIDT
jgi:hypothetical protein